MFVLAAALLLTGPKLPVVPVDFRLGGQVARNAGAAAVGSDGIPLPLAPDVQVESPGSAGDATADDNTPAIPPKRHFLLAQGFGHDVPLVFALRQVVPTRVHIIYGPGVDEQQNVSWEGGKPWDQVLRSTIKPLGLHVVMSPKAVKIVE